MSDELLRKRLLDIFDSLQIVLERFEGIKSSEDFLKDKEGLKNLDSISMRLQAIGEAIKKISKEAPYILDQYREIDWKGVINFRDKISHHYFDIDSEEIFKICNNEIPLLKKTINNIISNLETHGNNI
jgi:uncharacterized protein with HEPN domain